MSERRLRCAVIGAGKMGSLHAQKYAAAPEWELVAVVDIDAAVAARVAQRVNAAALTDYREVLGTVDAVSVAVPTALHHRVARDFLAAGCHVLVEKPIAVTVAEADELIALARRMRCTLQVGHVERFNAAVLALDLERRRPRFIEATRIAPFSTRGADVSVVLDLMIHDIDLILALVDAEVERVDAVGTPVFTDDIDIANARLVFADGCVANVTASRVSQKVERKMRLFLADGYASIDFLNNVVQRVRLGEPRVVDGAPNALNETLTVDAGDALAAEIRCFGDCIRGGREPPTSGAAARRALALAARIGALLDRGGRDGPRRADA
ncbi:MAG TPA: Gfo/Idh/MocA family oxidoreductase [Burkholderiaceae bacterium]|jgi:predicted dehydrogenase|nr:Gfo/Idh/MocA family oxidoreductase [Burkholderiaceae bacterium]